MIKYTILALGQMGISAFLTTIIVYVYPNGGELLFKLLVDMFLFLASYYIQQRVVFRKL